jgi:competence protein ComEC
MVEKSRMPPVLSAALGAALGYYGLVPLGHILKSWAPWFLGGMILFTVFLSLFRVLAQGPVRLLGSSSPHRLFREISIRGFALGMGLFLGTGAAGAADTRIRLGLEEEKVIGIRGILRDDPRTVSGGRGMGYLDLRGAAGSGGIRTSARGTVPVFFPADTLSRLQGFGRACEIYVEGSFLSPSSPAERETPFRSLSVHVIKQAPVPEQFRTALRLRVIEEFSRLSSGKGLLPYGGLSLALLLGVRDNLDTGFARMYRDAGCSHVLALSGMHLAIVSSVIAFFLRKPLGLRAAALLGALFIVLYVLLVGPQPSLVRAAIMYLLGTLAILGALPRRALTLLALSFILQIIADPPSGYTPSFILSYLALAGILILGEALGELFRGKLPPALVPSLAASLGAFIATGAVTVHFFEVLRPVGIAAGLFIVPLTTLFMAASMGVLALDFLVPPLAGPVSGFLSLLYALLEKLVSLAARAPGFSFPSLPLAAVLSAALSFLILLLKSRYITGRRCLAPFD